MRSSGVSHGHSWSAPADASFPRRISSDIILRMADPHGELLVETAVRLRLLTREQADEARKLRSSLDASGLPAALPEILLKKERLTRDQMRSLQILTFYEEARAEDEKLGALLIRTGRVTEDRVRECLELQRAPYDEGRPFPRLQDLVVRKGFLTAAQLEEALHSRGSVEMTRMIARPVPVKPGPAEFRKKTLLDGGLLVEGCRVALRRHAQKDSQGHPFEIAIVDVEGVLDGHTFKPFDEYMERLVSNGLPTVLLNFAKVDYVSSAGIGVLAGAVKRCRDARGDLRLFAVQEKVKKIINLVGLHSMLRLHDDEKTALQSMKLP